MESKKVALKNLFTGQQWGNRHREEGGEGGIHGKSNTETYIAACKIDGQWEFTVWLRKLK